MVTFIRYVGQPMFCKAQSVFVLPLHPKSPPKYGLSGTAARLGHLAYPDGTVWVGHPGHPSDNSVSFAVWEVTEFITRFTQSKCVQFSLCPNANQARRMSWMHTLLGLGPLRAPQTVVYIIGPQRTAVSATRCRLCSAAWLSVSPVLVVWRARTQKCGQWSRSPRFRLACHDH